jgi:hypothetical protein
MAKRGRNTVDGQQSSSGVGGDDRDRQGQRIQDPESPWARGENRSGGRAGEAGASRNTGSGPRPNKAGRGSTVDTGDRASRSEKPTGERKRSGSDSNRS